MWINSQEIFVQFGFYHLCRYATKCRLAQGNVSSITTRCSNKHRNSVTNSISSFQIILWFSMVIPTEKAVICKSLSAMFKFCLLMFWLNTIVLSKTKKLQYTNRVNLSVFTVHLAENLYTHLYSLLPFS